MEYERRHKEKFPVLAICYDFDKTLSPDDMQAQGYIQSVSYNINDFWENPMIWQRTMTWILIWRICIR